ncbi:hypothetical protein [Phreatobacter sp. AB_2022a]|uniref:hypothetical protein n=1 Tax=Phreatobacter sp. AB_2022a TaxID=3003134 RepID=UPI002286FB7E|nr:hypothetical protein [Phreatobacter sp. AB_2022a]MCZ0734776.1 hypothetical protein [Phreatobacter sp. AB_2022a]
MAIGQVGAPGAGAAAPVGPSAGGAAGGARNAAPQRLASTDVRVTLSPAARQHLSRVEGFVATIGTPKQPKSMEKPGGNIDLRI